MTTLVIAEKPSLAKEIAKALPGTKTNGEGFIKVGGDIVVSWLIGHVLEKSKPDAYVPNSWDLTALPIIPKKWLMEVKPDTKKQFNIVKTLLKDADLVVNAGDADREGQLLVDEVLDYCKYKGKVKRLWLLDLTEATIRKAWDAMKSNVEYAGYRDSAEGRSRSDWLVGMNMTVASTLLARRDGLEGVYSVGRVQSPTLRLMRDRRQAIEAFVSTDYFEVQGKFALGGKSLTALWQSPAEGEGIDAEGRVLDRRVVDAICSKVAGKPAVVLDFKSEKKSQTQPLPHNLTTLQQLANSRYGYSAQKTLDVVQSLYDGTNGSRRKVCSYPRTDISYYPEEMFSQVKDLMASVVATDPSFSSLVAKANLGQKSKAWDSSKVASHYGLMPTLESGDISKMSKEEANIYRLVVNQFLCQFYPAHEYLQNAVLLEVEKEKFRATGKTVVKAGWREIFGKDDEDEEEPAVDVFTKGDKGTCTEALALSKKTKPPAHFTEASLLKAMSEVWRFVTDPKVKAALKGNEELGILPGLGTPATRASIIELLVRRGYVEKKGKQLICSNTGNALIHVIESLNPVLCDPELTAVFEGQLELVSRGKITLAEFMGKQGTFIERLVTVAKDKMKAGGLGLKPTGGHECGYCGRNLRRIKGKSGYFWGCSGYPVCKATYEDVKGKPKLGKK